MALASSKLVDAAYITWKASPVPEAADALYKQMFALAKTIMFSASAPCRDIDELAHDAVAKALEKEHLFSGSAAFSTWFFRVAMNVHLQRVRTEIRERLRIQSLDSALWEPEGLPQKYDDGTLEKLLAKVSPKEMAMVRCWLEGQGVSEIAQTLGLHRRAAQARWRRMLLRLRKFVDGKQKGGVCAKT